MTEDMTVKKLIERLSHYEGSLVVMLSGDYGYGASLDVYNGDWAHVGRVWEEE